MAEIEKKTHEKVVEEGADEEHEQASEFPGMTHIMKVTRRRPDNTPSDYNDDSRRELNEAA